MKIEETGFPDLLKIIPSVFVDERGYFLEAYHREKFNTFGITEDFVQDNVSCSHVNVLRGLHFQNPPFAQGKLVQVLSGSVLDVVVDLRKSSPTYLKNYSIFLTAKDHVMLYIPAGFAHGFVSLEDNTLFHYKCTAGYNKEAEGGIHYNDAMLNIDWKIKTPIISDKDKVLPYLSEATILF
jgi:dTDP-4-dehydrorhamnose 3,5-epimerase